MFSLERENWFGNVGGALKNIAYISFVIETWIIRISSILAFLAGFIFAHQDPSLLLLIPIGVVAFFLAPCLTWVMNALLYGIGEVIENSAVVAMSNLMHEKESLVAIKEIIDAKESGKYVVQYKSVNK